jgi:hypothetical protein
MDSIAPGKQSPAYTSQSIYATNSWLLFACICLLSLFSTYYIQANILTDQVYYNSLADRLTADKIASLIHTQQRIRILSYLMVPAGLLLKITLVSFCIYTGLQFTSYALSFRTVFKIALFAETASVVYTLLRLFLLSFFYDVNTFNELQSFAPLSVFSLLNAATVPQFLQYPLQVLNLFELLYCLLLAAGLRFFLKQPMGKMIGLVLASYGLGLLCWMLCVVFLNTYLTT